MKKSIKISILFFALIIADSCSKYPDGPKFSLRTKKARAAGDWKIETIAKNGVDITSSYLDLVGANYRLDVEKSGAYKVSSADTSSTGLGTVALTDPQSGKWELGEDKDDIYFTPDNGRELSFKILRLMNKSLWLRNTESNGNSYEIHYVPAD